MDMVEDAANGLLEPMRTFRLDFSIADFAPTLCSLWGLQQPQQCQGKAIGPVLQVAREKLGADGKLSKTLLFCPDAIGDVLWKDFPDDFTALRENTDVRITSASVMPSVTPVCFGTIFTGASPQVHGIQEYRKPVLTVETIFDVFVEDEKKVAIIAVNNCSIDKIFRDRKVDYYSLTSNAQSFAICKLLLDNLDYDLIICYDGGYDSSVHKTGCRSPESLAAMRLSIARFLELTSLLEERWSQEDFLLAFTPDHGAHDLEDGKGGHGSNLYDDMVVNHFYRFSPAKKRVQG
jgi:predicted AlkP superfamily pyrophosphatase or phosphodiesterase